MPGERKFGTSPFGFNKSDVNAYIEKLVREFDQRIKEKDDEISNLKMQIREMKARYDTAETDSAQINKDKELIANTLIQAQDKAAAIVEDARKQAEQEKIKLDTELENEREKIIDLKRDIKSIKEDVIEMLSKFRSSLEQAENYIEEIETKYFEPGSEQAS